MNFKQPKGNTKIKHMVHGSIANVNSLKDLTDEILRSPDSQVVTRFISLKEVEKKRKDLFDKKVFY